ncbi:extracellular solute-binding protein [Streptomyces zingiberis]|uniref:extracellular solute-binding protein n=1 Tax=Streptomyces zingiberis TaxID=2053010 RepID=UPI00289301D3|nr:extracellular solute-binding protein [Streptomyces zingiberis]
MHGEHGESADGERRAIRGTGPAARRRYRGAVAAAVATALALALSGCGGSPQDVTLRLVAADYGGSDATSSRRYWDRVVAGYESEHPGVTIDVTVHHWKVVDGEIAAMVKRGEAPDIAQTASYAGHADRKRLYRADELLSIPTQADFLPGLAEGGKFQRVQYGLPFAADTRLLFWNKTLFAEAGLDGPPGSWPELREAAEALRDAGVTIPYALPLGPEEAQAETAQWSLGAGGGLTDGVGAYTLDAPENVRAFQWLRDELVRPGLTGPGAPAALDRQAAFDAFSRGEVGMVNGHPALIRQAARNGVQFGTAPPPGREGPAETSVGVNDWLVAFRQNGHREEIGDFLDHVYSEPNMLEFADRHDMLPVTRSASGTMRAADRYQPLWDFLDRLPDSVHYPANKITWNRVSGQLKEGIGQAVERGGDPAGILSRIQRDAEATENAIH